MSDRNSFFGGDIEYFNGNEWVKISNYNKKDKVMTFFEDEHCELLTPIEYIKVKSKGLNRIETMPKLNLVISDEALFLGRYRQNDVKDFNTKFTFKVAYENNYHRFSHALLYSVFKYDNGGCNSMLSKDNLIVMLMSITLGEIQGSNCTIVVKEYNKYINCISFLKRGKVNYKTSRTKKKEYMLKFRLPRNYDIFIKNPLTFSTDEIVAMVDEFRILTDYKDKVKLNNPEVYDFIQMIFALYGKRVAIKDGQLIFYKTLGVKIQDVKSVEYEKVDFQYSFTTKSGFLLLRSNGFIFTMGDYKK